MSDNPLKARWVNTQRLLLLASVPMLMAFRAPQSGEMNPARDTPTDYLGQPRPGSIPHVSPNGDFLLFDRWFQSSPYLRIMVSFREPGGGWRDPVDLSPYTKSEGNDSVARLSADGRYLFFQSVREGSDPNRSVYWMDAAFLERIRGESEGSPGDEPPPASTQ